MKSLFRVSFINHDAQAVINVLCDNPEQAVAQAGNPTAGVTIQAVVANVEVFGVDAPHAAPSEPMPVVTGPPQNIPLTPAEVAALRQVIGGAGDLTQAEIDRLRADIDTVKSK